MTLPPAPSAVPEVPPPPAPELAPLSAVAGNRAALTLLVVQNVVAALCMGTWLTLGGKAIRVGLGLPLGASLLIAFVVNMAVALTLFRPQMQALFRDSRWRTPPSWGLAIGAFVLAFLTSRAFTLAYVALVPSAAGSVPEFRSQGLDIVPLLIGAGLLIPLAEEVAFRGLMLRGQERAAGFLTAALATSLAFALAHGVPASIAGILPLAYVLARLTQHTGSLWNAVIVHMLNNTLAVGVGLFVLKNINPEQANADLLGNSALRLPLALGALLFGVAVLVVLHLWLTPKADPEVADPKVAGSRGPWLSGAWVVIVLFGLVMALLTLPSVQNLLSRPQGIMQ